MKGSLQVGTLFAGRFRIESELGSGGMGIVYRAVHEVLQRAIAVKVLHGSLLGDPNILGRFQREARAAARIDHPNVTHIIDFGHSDDGIPYLVMEFVEGEPLWRLVEREGVMSVERSVAILAEIARGVTATHRAGVIHRDLKPGNVMVAPDPAGGDRVRICDFGLAKIVDPGSGAVALSAQGLGFGTPEYMSPEHCSGRPIDHRADIYSLGLIAFAMLCGRPPFTGSRHRVRAAHINKMPPEIRTVRGAADIPDHLQQVVSRCLAKKPEDRYATADDVVREMDLVRRSVLTT